MAPIKTSSKNLITIPQLKLACRHVKEMEDAGMTENFAIRGLELFADAYARQSLGGRGRFQPLHVRHIDLWSKAALKMKKRFPKRRPLEYLRVEHGTPRREFARLVLNLYKKNRLTDLTVKHLVQRYWKLAVITLEEDGRLNKVARKTMLSSPWKRWAKAKIRF